MKFAQSAAMLPREAPISITTDVMDNRGKAVPVEVIHIHNKHLVTAGRLLTIARLKDEWYEDAGEPELIMQWLKQLNPAPDIFTFWQRLPDTEPVYSYYHEPEALSAIPLTKFSRWWTEQIRTDTRKKAKRAEKRGIQIRVVDLDDAFVRGVMGIFNETPVRRGKPCRHYGKSLEELREMLSTDLDRSTLVGAYEGDELIGFVKLNYAPGRFANPGLIVSKLTARKKYVNNALLAKSVELSCDHGVPYLTYTGWRRGTQAEFLIRHGFQKVFVPRYWLPVTKKGMIAIKLGLHRDIRTHIPDRVMGILLKMRGTFYSWRYRSARNAMTEDLEASAEVAEF